MIKNPPANAGMWVQSPGWEDPLGEGHGNPLHVLASRIPWKEAPGRLQVHGV